MSLDTIPPSFLRDLSPLAKSGLGKLTDQQQAMFVDEYKRKRRSTAAMWILAFFFLWIYFLVMKRGGLAAISFFTFGGVGVWWFIELFKVGGRVKEYNQDIASGIIRDIKTVS